MQVDAWAGFVLLVTNVVFCEAKITLDRVHHWFGAKLWTNEVNCDTEMAIWVLFRE